MSSYSYAIDTRKQRIIPQLPANKISLHGAQRGHSLLIFVHGWSSSSNEAWINSSAKTNLLDLILNDPVYDGFDVLPYEYKTNFVFNADGVKKLARSLAARINQKSIYEAYRQYFLIGHSMGGLVIKGAVLDLLTDGKRHVLKNCQGVLTFGTPHSGTIGAIVLSGLQKMLRKPDPQAVDLEAFSDITTEYNQTWKHRVIQEGNRIPTYLFWGENDPIVKEGSACPPFFEATCDMITNEDHWGIVKPKDRSHITYELIKDKILDEFGLNKVVIYSHGDLKETNNLYHFLEKHMHFAWKTQCSGKNCDFLNNYKIVTKDEFAPNIPELPWAQIKLKAIDLIGGAVDPSRTKTLDSKIFLGRNKGELKDDPHYAKINLSESLMEDVKKKYLAATFYAMGVHEFNQRKCQLSWELFKTAAFLADEDTEINLASTKYINDIKKCEQN